MSLEYITTYNTNGDEISVPNLVNQMVNYYGDKLEVGETRVTDFQEGSEIRNLLEAFAIGIYALLEEQHENTKIAFISTSYGMWLDKIGELPFINLKRIESSYASGTVTFTLATAQSDDYTIPADTLLACSDTGLEFITTSECVISTGDTTGEASVECLSTGSDGNVSAGSIDTVSSEFVNTDLVSVSNSSALTGGADAEDDEDYRTRLLNDLQKDGFGTLGYYQRICEEIDGVHDVLFLSDASYTRKVIVNGYVKETPNAVLLDVLTALTDNDNHILNHSFTIDKPTYTTVPLSITLDVTSEIPETNLNNVMTCLFNGGEINGFQYDFDGLNINQSITRQEIVDTLELMENVVSVTSIENNLGEEITTLTPSDTTKGVLKLGTITYTQNEV